MKRSFVRLISLTAILSIGILVLTQAALAKCYTYTTLDEPNGAGSTSAAGINANGDIVGHYLNGTYCPPCNASICPGLCGPMNHGFLYQGGVYTTLDDPDGVNGTVFGINKSGDIVGIYDDSSGAVHGFLFDGSSYTTRDDPDGVNGTVASGINDSGDIVGYYLDSSNREHGFLYDGSSYTTLDDPDGSTFASGINDSGEVVGWYFDSSGGVHGFLYDGSSYVTLDDPNGVGNTYASGINNNGDIVGYYDDSSGEHGFLAAPVPLWQDATAAGEGWYHLSPFGFFYPTPSTWIYHQGLGWLYPAGTTTGSIWFYDPQWDGKGGWWWTSSSVFPWLYSVTENGWFYYDMDSPPGSRLFYGPNGWGTH